MAELKCSDGTVIKISDETEQELRKAFGPKPREIQHGDVFLNTICPSGQQTRIVMACGGLWRIYCDKESFCTQFEGYKEKLDEYINSRTGEDYYDNYVFQYNLFTGEKA